MTPLFSNNFFKARQDSSRYNPTTKNIQLFTNEIWEIIKESIEDFPSFSPKNIAVLGRQKNIYTSLVTQQFSEAKINNEQHPYDLVIAPLEMHLINDIPAFTKQIYQSLNKEKSLTLTTSFGGKTLQYFSEAIWRAEEKIRDGALPRVHPVIDIKDTAALFYRSGFKNVITTSYSMEFEYPNLTNFINDMKSLGEGNGLITSINSPKYILPKGSFIKEIETHYPLEGKTKDGYIIDVEVILTACI